MSELTEASNTYRTQQKAPSNIAIVKYWGKKNVQEPVNPSISFTLKKAYTETSVVYQPSDHPLNFEFYFEDQHQPGFEPKLNSFIEKIRPFLPFLNNGHLVIKSANTFPHSSGIASSASSMAALAKCFCDIQNQLTPSAIYTDEATLSSLARLGSGSGARSVKEGWALWGKTPNLAMSSDNYAVYLNEDIHPTFRTIKDAILIIERDQKKVSSTAGHQLMERHPYRDGRIAQANENTKHLLIALTSGDFDTFATICEEEALSLHGLMMSSKPGYTLLAPESLMAIERIKAFREQHQLPITFSIDAGPNLHVLYPASVATKIEAFLKEQLAALCQEQTILFDTISMNSSILTH